MMIKQTLNRMSQCVCMVAMFLAMVMPCLAQNAESNEAGKSKQPGLLILSHGTPEPQWNEPVNTLVERVRKQNEDKETFHAIEGAFLEFTQPDAAAGIEKLEAAGCDRIIVVPLFIAPSSHSLFDVPAVLGLYSSPEIRQTLEEEGARVAQPRVPLTLTHTLSEGVLLDGFARDEVRSLSKDPANEAVVLIAHGCRDHNSLVERMTRRIATFCCGQCGIDYADWAYCAVGQTFWEEAEPVIARAAEHKGRVLVVGLYVSSSAKRIYERAVKKVEGLMGTEFKSPFNEMDIVFSSKGLVDYPATADWLLKTARETLRGVPMVTQGNQGSVIQR